MKIYNPQIAKEVYKRAMEVPIMLMQRELLSLSPEVRAQVAEVTTKKRLPSDPVATTIIEEVSDNDEPQFPQRPMTSATIKEIPDEDKPKP